MDIIRCDHKTNSAVIYTIDIYWVFSSVFIYSPVCFSENRRCHRMCICEWWLICKDFFCVSIKDLSWIELPPVHRMKCQNWRPAFSAFLLLYLQECDIRYALLSVLVSSASMTRPVTFGNKECSTGSTVYPKKYAHGFCFAVLCCGYTLTDFPISIRLTSLALWQSNDCPSTSKATLMNMDKYFMWIPYERLHNHNKAKHNKTVCIFLGIYCITHILIK